MPKVTTLSASGTSEILYTRYIKDPKQNENIKNFLENVLNTQVVKDVMVNLFGLNKGFNVSGIESNYLCKNNQSIKLILFDGIRETKAFLCSKNINDGKRNLNKYELLINNKKLIQISFLKKIMSLLKKIIFQAKLRNQ